MAEAIERWRAQIDDIDRQLLELLNARARAALEVGASKRARGLPVLDLRREAEVLTRVRARNEGPLSDRAVERLFTRIIHESRMLEGEVLSGREMLAVQAGR